MKGEGKKRIKSLGQKNRIAVKEAVGVGALTPRQVVRSDGKNVQ
jgi:hypothetical protein